MVEQRRKIVGKKNKILLIIFMIGLGMFIWGPIKSIYSDIICSKTFKTIDNQFSTYSAEEIARLELELIERAKLDANEDPFDLGNNILENYFDVPIPANGASTYTDAVGYISIPKLNVQLPLFIGSTKAILAIGVGQIVETDLPMKGIGTNCVIAGHRGYSGRSMFLYINTLEPGDLIYLTYMGQNAVYEVYGQSIISPTDSDKLGGDEEYETLTLFTCNPIGYNYQRLLVHAKRIEDPGVESTSDTDASSTAASETAASESTKEDNETSGNTNSIWDSIFLFLARISQPLNYFFVGSGICILIICMFKLFRKPKKANSEVQSKQDKKKKKRKKTKDKVQEEKEDV